MSSVVGLAVVFAVAWGVAFTAVAVARAHDALAPRLDALHFAVVSAMYEAHARAHERMTHVHLALALSFDPDVAARIDRVGSVDELRDRLDAHLRAHHDGEDDIALVPTPDPYDPTILAFVDDLRAGDATRTPDSYVGALLDSLASTPEISPDLHAIFGACGLTGRAWARADPTGHEHGDERAVGLPYRTRASSGGEHRIRFWNDDKTPQAMVVSLLTGGFGRTPIEARHIMLRTHFLGSADFGELDRTEAERLVADATTVARDAGFPLRITVERRGPGPSVSSSRRTPGFWARFRR